MVGSAEAVRQRMASVFEAESEVPRVMVLEYNWCGQLLRVCPDSCHLAGGACGITNSDEKRQGTGSEII